MAYKTDTSLDAHSKGEIIANSITHGIGVALSIAGLVILNYSGGQPGNRLASGRFSGFRNLFAAVVFGLHGLPLICQQTLERYLPEAGPRHDLFPDRWHLYTIPADSEQNKTGMDCIWYRLGFVDRGINSQTGVQR